MSKPIGIFDSGLGGLTVLKELAKNFPHESFVYLGDIARLPYGNKSPETIRKYGDQILRFLKDQDVKAMVIACNSASTVYLGEKSFEGIPLLNVIEPGSKAALEKGTSQIAVLGTSATIRSGAYAQTIKGMNPKTNVTEIACPLFVPLVEEGVVGNEITDLVIKRYLSQVKADKIGTVILGCTHYPVLAADIRKFLGNVNLVESGEVLTRELKALNLTQSTGTRQIRVCITDVTDHFERLAKELMYPETLGPLEKVIL
ncbi:MAG: glutamate racemase [Bdellovibrionota bacterium]